jgi:hypothetical protein
VTTTQNVPTAITLTGSDPDNDPITFSIVTGPAHGSLTGTAPNVTYTPAPGFTGTDQFTFQVNDGLTNSAVATVSITVNGPPALSTPPAELAGRMHGEGHLKVGAERHHFEFEVTKRSPGHVHGSLHYRMQTEHGAHHHGRFVSTSVTSAIFSDDPTIRPSRRSQPSVDTVVMSGAGRWNGMPGYTFVMTAKDAGEPGRGRDSFTLTITSPSGETVLTVSGVLAGGNIQSLPVRSRGHQLNRSER